MNVFRWFGFFLTVCLFLTLFGCENPGSSNSAVSGVTISPASASVARGGTRTFTAIVIGTKNPAQTVIWTVDGGAAETGITTNGLLIVALNETATTLTVRATSTMNTTKSGTATITISGEATVSDVTIDPPIVAIIKGKTQQFTANVTGINNPAQTVTWTVQGGGAGTSITANGLLTVDANESSTTLTVKATSTVNTGKSGVATVIVQSSGVDLTGEIVITGITRTGYRLTANTDNLYGNGAISYWWKRASTPQATGVNITDATDRTYILGIDDINQYITVMVTRAGNSGSITSTAVGPVEFDPGNTDPPIVEEVSLTNGFYVVYRVDLPVGTYWGDYEKLTVDYKIDDGELLTTPGSSRAMRLMGPYVMPNAGDFTFICLNESGKGLAIAPYNNGKNGPYIIDELSALHEGTIKEVAEAQGVNVTVGEWFTLPYRIDGSRAHSQFEFVNKPANNATGPFYFGVGWTGNIEQSITTVQQIRNVTLVGLINVIATPAIFEDQEGNLYSAFTGYAYSNGSNGAGKAERITISGEFNPIKVTLDEIPSND
jgi:hypothetical protein